MFIHRQIKSLTKPDETSLYANIQMKIALNLFHWFLREEISIHLIIAVRLFRSYSFWLLSGIFLIHLQL